MPNVFPNILADTMKRRRKKFQKRIRREDGGLQVNVPHPVEQFVFHGEWNTLSGVDLASITDHFDVNGTGTFTLFDNDRYVSSLQFGVGNGTTTIFTLPAKSTVGLIIKKNGVTQTITTNYTVSVGTGTDGEDQVTFVVAPALNDVLTFSATTARRRHTVWYTTEELEEEPIEADIWRLIIDFEEKVA
jgi:hypothetical protein